MPHATQFHAETGPAHFDDGSQLAWHTEDEDAMGPPVPALYDLAANDVAGYVEKRSAVDLIPEGAKMGVDVSLSEEEKLKDIFMETPDIFKHCTLVRDFATPLRVGSAIISRNKAKMHQGRGSRRKAGQQKGDAVSNDGDDDDDNSEDDEDSDDETEEDSGPEVGDDELVAKGGVVDIDEAPDGKADEALAEVSVIANLESTVGQVGVVPNGIIAKWGSKKKVPIAGYLCTSSTDAVLHTLSTPCLATTLSEDGTPATPLPALEDGELAPPAPAPPGFSVYVGSVRLEFSSQLHAAKFCREIAEEIADDPGFNEWDTDKLKGRQLEMDMQVSSFVQLTRKDPPEAWTTGTKKVLVLVMDWMAGDQSKAPLTKQSLTPAFVKSKIFPRVKSAFKTMSYGKFDIEYEVVPEIIRYTESRSRYAADGWPFPGLYNGATQSLAGHRTYGSKYNVNNYDLVYTISPQQAPTGTKGVAWVGAKGAMCNGCEAISENFQVMVAVHELGHNLGLSHAGSGSLEYGNPFDWMGNYPDVQGLSYGMGYKLKLHWLPRASVAKIDDNALSNLNDRFILLPFDARSPLTGEIAGIQLSLRKNSRDIFISYRQTAGREAGIYLVFQDKDKPDSELIDMACHSPSQKDARLQQGWTYIDPSSQVVVVVESVAPDSASVHVYETPTSTNEQAMIRARDTFTDGVFKCPRTCTDSDLLLANFKGCAAVARDGYCKSGQITMGGSKYSVKTDLCPNACGECSSVLAGSTRVSGCGCCDRDIKISGMSCPAIAQKGHCGSNTNIGNIGKDLCPASCGNCPRKPNFNLISQVSASSYSNPSPKSTHGSSSSGAYSAPPPSPPPPPPASSSCEDDATWTDSDGDGCSVYKHFIEAGKLTQSAACDYGNGEASTYCRETCGKCSSVSKKSTKSEKCEDSKAWIDGDGDGCKVYAKYIAEGKMTRTAACAYGDGAASQNCKKTCNTCDTAGINSEEPDETILRGPKCKDAQCFKRGADGECFKCKDFAADYCGNDEEFMKLCPRSCKLCNADGTQVCKDDFKKSSCDTYKGLGWCEQIEISQHCKATCGVCRQLEQIIENQSKPILDIASNQDKLVPVAATTPVPDQMDEKEDEEQEGDEKDEKDDEEHPHSPRRGGDDEDEEESRPAAADASQMREREEDIEEEAEPEARKPLPPAFRIKSAASPRGSAWVLPSLLLVAGATASGLAA